MLSLVRLQSAEQGRAEEAKTERERERERNKGAKGEERNWLFLRPLLFRYSGEAQGETQRRKEGGVERAGYVCVCV